MKSKFFFCIVTVFFLFFGQAHSSVELVPFLRTVNKISFCGKTIPLDKENVRERLEKEILLSLWDKAQVILWIKRSARYFPVIEKNLKLKRLHTDLKYVAVIESALRPGVKSHKDAVGFWQFIPSTGTIYGLTIDQFLDERMDVEKSTVAASAYLTDLFERFQTWELALAAYNIGEMRIQKELESQRTDSYYELWLPEETMRYFFKVLAAKVIFENSEKLGFVLDKDDFYEEYKTKPIKLNLKSTIPITLAAQSLDISFYRFKILNPFIVGDYFKKGESVINIPEKTDSKKFFSDFKKIRTKWVKEHKIFYYTVKKGDSLIKIADEFQVRIKEILRWNKLDYKDYIYPGQKLMIKSIKNES